MDEYIKREEVYTVIRFLRKQDHPKETETTADIIADSLARTIENTCDFVEKAVGIIPAADVRENIRARWKCTALGNYACSYCCKEPYYSCNI